MWCVATYIVNTVGFMPLGFAIVDSLINNNALY